MNTLELNRETYRYEGPLSGGEVLCVDHERLHEEWDQMTDPTDVHSERLFSLLCQEWYWRDQVGTPGVYYASQARHYRHQVSFAEASCFHTFEGVMEDDPWWREQVTLPSHQWVMTSYDGRMNYRLVFQTDSPIPEEQKKRIERFPGVVVLPEERTMFDLPRL